MVWHDAAMLRELLLAANLEVTGFKDLRLEAKVFQMLFRLIGKTRRNEMMQQGVTES
jgi:hypothetical protein